MFVGFHGRYEYTVDDRGRLPIPPRFRAGFGDDPAWVVDGQEGCLELYTQENFQRKAERLTSISGDTLDGRRVQRAFWASAMEVPVDKQGRILIPAAMRDAAVIDGNVVVVGRGELMEIWNRERWDQEQATVREGAAGALERLSERLR
jgi:transcriptional regulator MraZ